MTKFDKWALTKLKEDKDLNTWLPVKVIYTDDLPQWVGGRCHYKIFGAEIKIKTKYKENDPGILAHELTHAKQYGNLFWLHLLLKSFDKYTLFIELDAYREQIKAYNYIQKGQYLWIVNALLDPKRYGLKISLEEAIEYADFMFSDLIEENIKKEK